MFHQAEKMAHFDLRKTDRRAYEIPTSYEGRSFVVMGAGTLGRRIALMWLTKGGIVHLVDNSQKTLDDAKSFISSSLPDVIHDHVPTGQPGTLRLFTDRSEALKSAWIVTECVPEIRDIKVKLMGELDRALPMDVILATNSSSFMASEICDEVENKARVVNMHYYMPPESRPVEIMPTEETDEAIVDILMKKSAEHGFIPFHARKPSVGLIANRIWAAVKRESLLVVAEGVSEPAEIDSLLAIALGFRVFANLDNVGLDVARDIERHYLEVRKDVTNPAAADLLDSYISQGKLGAKSGEGFFKHPKTIPQAQDHLIYLDIAAGEVRSLSMDGKQAKTLVSGLKDYPDGIQLDQQHGKLYWTCMGASPKTNSGRIVSANVDGSDVKDLIPSGGTHTPKQIYLDVDQQVLYWCDREGGRIQRCNTDGSALQTLYDSAPGKPRPLEDARDWCVGIVVDKARNLIYWSQKGASKAGQGRILRKELSGDTGPVETLFAGLPEPVDLDINIESQQLYWTDRGEIPFGNTLNMAAVSSPFNPLAIPRQSTHDFIIADHFHEAIGLTCDFEHNKIYVADLSGSLWDMDADGKNKRSIVMDRGNYSGVVFQPAPR